MKLTHLSLFSGIGGLDIAAEWAGFETVGQCEFADFPTKILEKHWPDVPRWRDIRTLTQEDFYARTGLRTVDIISGGFPCQPFSVAGKQKGKGDDRYLWPEMLRVIRELRPRWVLGENVPGILRIAGDDVCKDLEREGYDVGIFNFEAAAVGAPHRRERVFFVANRNNGQRQPAYNEIQAGRDATCIGGCVVGNTKHNGLSSATITGSSDKAGRNAQEGKDPARKFERTGRSGNDETMANTGCGGCGRQGDICDLRKLQEWTHRQGETDKLKQSGKVSAALADSDSVGLQKERPEQQATRIARKSETHASHTNNRSGAMRGSGELPAIGEACGTGRNYGGGAPEHVTRQRWPAEPDVGRVANGVPSRVDRLKGLGNAVVPPQAYPIFKAIAEIIKPPAGGTG